MRETYAILANRLSVFEFYNSILLILAIAVGTLLLSLYLANSRRLSVAAVLASASAPLISLITFLILFFIPSITLNNRYTFAFYIPAVLNSFLFILTIFEYMRLQKSKNFDLDFVSRFHFTNSLNLSIVFMIGSLTLIAFIPGELAFIISLTFLNTLLSLSATHLIVRRYITE